MFPESIKKILIPKKDLLDIIGTARKNKNEICGVLIGYIEDHIVVVTEIRHTRNVRESSIEFEVDPVDLYRVIMDAEKRNLDVVGIFHSHPTSPHPSESDIAGMKLWPVVWLIISSIDGSYSCFILDDEKIRNVPIELI